MYYAPDKFFVHPTTKGSPVFESQNIYVSFESHVGISISVRVRSTDPKGHRKKKEERVYVDMEYEDDDVRNPFYELLKKMEKQQKEAFNKNFIAANKIKFTRHD